MRKLCSWRSRSRAKKHRVPTVPTSDMAAKQKAEQSEQSTLSIFINDFTDSDNEASAEVWAWGLEQNPSIKGIYIAEPRWVNLGYYMASSDFGKCIGLVGRLEPPLEGGDPALTTVLAGRMTKEIIDNRQVDGRKLNDEEKTLVSKSYQRVRRENIDFR